MIVLMRILLVVCKIMDGDSDGTLRYEEWLECGRQSVYKERLFGVGGFPFLLSLLILLYRKAIDDFRKISQFLFLALFPR